MRPWAGSTPAARGGKFGRRRRAHAMSNDLVLAPSRPPAVNNTLALAEVMARSGFFGDSRDAAQAAVKILAGREMGFGVVQSMTGIHVVKGRITLSANLIAAAIRRSGRYDYRVK